MDDSVNPQMGRPTKKLDQKELRKLMQFKPSLRTTAGWFEVSESTILRRVKEFEDDPKMTFEVFRDKHMAGIKLALSQKAIQLALNGSERMIIWCQKNIDDWADHQDLKISQGEIKIKIDGQDKDL